MSDEKDFSGNADIDFKKIERKADIAIRWNSISLTYSAIVQFIMTIILAQIFTPKEYGIMGLILITLGFGTVFSDAGASGAIIHFQKSTKTQLSTLYWLSLIFGLIIFIILYLLSPLIALFYNEPELRHYIQFIALIFLVIPIGQQFETLLKKELKFKSLSLLEILNSTILVLVTIIFGYYGWGVISIIFGYILKHVVKSILLVSFGIKFSKPIFMFKFSEVKNFLSFGLYQMGERTINFLDSNIDKILIGKFLGIASLGYYNIAYNLVSYPLLIINPIFTNVYFPYFSKFQNNLKMLKEKYLNLISTISFINFPTYLLIILIAPYFVPIMYGVKWYPSIILVQILSIVFLFRAIVNTIGTLLLAKGYARLGFLWNLFAAMIHPFIILLGLYLGGINEVALSLLVSQIIFFYFFYHLLIKRVLGPCFREFLKSFGYFLMFGVFALIFGLLGCIIFQIPSNLIKILYYILFLIITYFTLVYIFKREFLLDFIERFIYNFKDHH